MTRLDLRRRRLAFAGSVGLLIATSGLHAQALTPDQVNHIANRLTYGATTQVKADITSGYILWLRDQLYPNFALENPAIPGLLATAGAPVNPSTLPGGNPTGVTINFRRPFRGVLVYSIHSKFQLAAKIGDFWDRHFNTYLNIVFQRYRQQFSPGSTFNAVELAIRSEWLDYERHRTQGFGQFADLAIATFKSPAMAVYLDTIRNVCFGSAARINENMAREMLELHMVGTNYKPTGALNYDAEDIELLSEAMSNWSTALAANNDPELVFGGAACTLPAATLFDAPNTGQLTAFPRPTPLTAQSIEDIINHIAGSEACKDFICRKLMHEFLGDGTDMAEPTLLTAMKAQWGARGDIARVLGVLLVSSQFTSGLYEDCRIRNPLETVAWHVRAWDGVLNDMEYARSAMDSLGQTYFSFAAPDGFPLESNEQPASAVSQTSYKLFTDSLFRSPYQTPISPPPPVYDFNTWVTQNVPVADRSDSVRVAEELLTFLYANDWTTLDRQIVTAALDRDSSGIPQPFLVTNSDYIERVTIGALSAMSLNQALTR